MKQDQLAYKWVESNPMTHFETSAHTPLHLISYIDKYIRYQRVNNMQIVFDNLKLIREKHEHIRHFVLSEESRIETLDKFRSSSIIDKVYICIVNRLFDP